MMRSITALWCLLFVAWLSGSWADPARANDSAVEGVGGSVRRMGGEHGSVRMARETVRIDLYPGYYETQADFTFVNDGPALTVKMGFPESGGGDVHPDGKRGGFLRFATTVDGKPTRAQRMDTQKGEGEGYEAFWVKEVPFRAGQTRQVRVRYRSPYGSYATPTLARWASYDFTGGNWKGKVGETRLIVTLREAGSFAVVPSFVYGTGKQEKRLGPGWIRRDGATFARTWRDWEAEGWFSLRLAKAPPGWLAGPREETYSNQFQGTPILTFTVPGKVTDANLGYDYAPTMMQADGITWLQLEQAPWTLEPVLAARNPKYEPDFPAEYKYPAKTASARLGDKTFGFTLGKASMTVDGRTVALPAPPRRVRVRGSGELKIYVPLAPVVKALGGTATVQAAQHTYVVRPLPATMAAAAAANRK